MKPIQFLPIALIAAAGLVASCGTPKLAQSGDDVYNTVAKARVVEYQAPAVSTQQVQPDYNDEYYGTSNPYYDMDYSSRISRFNNGYSWRGYYDPYYDNYGYNPYGYGYNSYGYNNSLGYGLSWGNGYGLGGWGFGGGFGYGYGYGSIWNNPYNYGYFGYNPYSFWGPNSYYDRFGWGGGYGYGGGYYGGGFGGGVYTNGSYRARPNRDGDNRGAYGSRRNSYSPNTVNNGRPNNTVNYGRPERYSNGSNGSNVSNGQSGRVSSRPTRDNSYTPQSRPEPQQAQPMGRPERSYSPPPQQSSGSSMGGGSGSSGGGGGGGRPTRGGR